MASSNVRQDRRGERRTSAVLAVGLASATKADRLGVTRDVSARGLAIVTPSRFAAGERLEIQVQTGKGGLNVVGRVARVDENAVASPEIWRYRVGVALDQPLPPSVIDSAVRR
ncbi:MAG TPA: PilZ domain-containing protein [Labilithrix sp.]|jgi:hypothetical protein|nr:PilZ domain-containing protein [Labilithrix sp.]